MSLKRLPNPGFLVKIKFNNFWITEISQSQLLPYVVLIGSINSFHLTNFLMMLTEYAVCVGIIQQQPLPLFILIQTHTYVIVSFNGHLKQFKNF